MPSWKLKAALQRAFSVVPGGHRINYVFQRHVTHGVPISDVSLERSIDLGQDHLARLAAAAGGPVTDGRFFEFGAGWDLHIPQILWCLGVDHQLVVDIRRLLRPELVFDIGRRLAAVADDLGLPRAPRADGRSRQDIDRYLTALGIRYEAPADARAIALPAGSIDVATSTNTLEHIPPADISAILRELRRVLAPGGLVSAQIDYRDHYSYFDPRISMYNFLRYDDAAWRRFSPDLHFQNRLRHHQHLALIADAGFEVVDEVLLRGDHRATAELKRMSLAPEFARHGFDANAICESRLVLRPMQNADT